MVLMIKFTTESHIQMIILIIDTYLNIKVKAIFSALQLMQTNIVINVTGMFILALISMVGLM